MKEKLRILVQKEFKKIFLEDVSNTFLYNGGNVESEEMPYPFGFDSFNTAPEETRWKIANNQFNSLKQQFDGDEEKAIENMPEYMLLYI